MKIAKSIIFGSVAAEILNSRKLTCNKGHFKELFVESQNDFFLQNLLEMGIDKDELSSVVIGRANAKKESRMSKKDFEFKIVGGWPVETIDNWPFIGHSDGCGGLYLGGKAALTAAHCCVNYGKPNNPWENFFFGHLRYGKGLKVPVDKYVIHPDYDTTRGLKNDLCVVKLSEDLDSKCSELGIKAIELLDSPLIPGENLHIAGWGTKDVESGMLSPDLLETKVKVLTEEECKNRFHLAQADITEPDSPDYDPDYVPLTVSDDQFCASHAELGIDSCQGDSGGPAVVLRQGVPKLAGIVSWGVGCGEYFPGTSIISPGVYAEVASEKARKWITDTLVSIGAGSTARDITREYGSFGVETVCAVAQKLSSRYPFEYLELLKKTALVESNFGNLGCAKNIFGGNSHSPLERAQELIELYDDEEINDFINSIGGQENCRKKIWRTKNATEIISKSPLPICPFEQETPQICLISIIDGSESISVLEFEQQKQSAFAVAEIALNLGVLDQKVFQFADVPILISEVNEDSPIHQFRKFEDDFLGQNQIGGGSVIKENIDVISAEYFPGCEKQYLILASDGFEKNYTISNFTSISSESGIEILPIIPSIEQRPIPESISEFSLKFHFVTKSHQQRKFFSGLSCHYFFILEEEEVVITVSDFQDLRFWYSETVLFPSENLHDELVYSKNGNEEVQMKIFSTTGLMSLAICNANKNSNEETSYLIEFLIGEETVQFSHGLENFTKKKKGVLKFWLPLFILILILILIIIILVLRKRKRAISPASSKTTTIQDIDDDEIYDVESVPVENDFEACSMKTYDADINEKLHQLENLAKVVFEKGTEAEVREVIKELQYYVGNEVATSEIRNLSDAGMRVLQLIDLQKGINGEIDAENYQRLKRIAHYAEFFVKPEETEFRGEQSQQVLLKANAVLEAEAALIRNIGDSSSYQKLSQAVLNLHSKCIENPAVSHHPKWKESLEKAEERLEDYRRLSNIVVDLKLTPVTTKRLYKSQNAVEKLKNNPDLRSLASSEQKNIIEKAEAVTKIWQMVQEYQEIFDSRRSPDEKEQKLIESRIEAKLENINNPDIISYILTAIERTRSQFSPLSSPR
ncbi:Oidioi.mRNA.OKI2018_I69.PAR.g8678.t1.cds [Oikopleura dioica]|uniref:Oidioi.mRNA.OKI2018_I69.PAR.g8678.t1.cds n=1 Tax=Oikopleura dioica TaxID=34765 RepID=A0ABN7RH48_OIKDI|nr:Oidioi.mRNA.OKI2018_I69.PAR.g8678.t1.cds [Oikopleura dioica]